MFTVVAAMPLTIVELPPFNDYTNHLVRLRMIAQWGADPYLDDFYQIVWAVVPNLAIDLILPPVIQLVGEFAAGKLFIVSLFVLQMTGIAAIQRATYGRVTVAPLLGTLFLYNLCLLYGLINYLLSVALALWAVAGWLHLRHRGLALRWAYLLVAYGVLFLTHLSGVGLFGLALGCIELSARPITRSSFPRHAIRILVSLGPSLLIVPVLMSLGSATDLAASETRWLLHRKRLALDWLVGSYYPVLDLAFAAALAAVAFWALRRRIMIVDRPGILLLIFGAGLFAVVPFTLLGAVFSDLRLVIGILFLTLGFVRLEFENARQVRVFLAGISGLLLLRVGSVAVAFLTMSPIIGEFRQSLANIRPGSRVMVMADDRHHRSRLLWTTGYAEDRDVFFALNQAPALVVTHRSSYVPIVFAQPGKQILEVRPEYRDLRNPEDQAPLVRHLQKRPSPETQDPGQRFKDWQRRFDYLYVLFTRPDDPAPFPNLELLAQGQHFRLYRLPH
ncbi:hypothetical protein JL101_032075 (plasmid) [Skermanella rosea]|uniref:hypothetical protein n=1 Tax=Skermanella rosea TaxID=1817965 RepID=UPI0019317B9B|nr:hypothetical protein [Skermanella rosea]UEM07563.1 hypothetical protein JL101_032075 [Skermanella rosea]